MPSKKNIVPKPGNAGSESASQNSNRRFADRRRMKSKGHMYISTVGWICRRENDRREKLSDTSDD